MRTENHAGFTAIEAAFERAWRDAPKQRSDTHYTLIGTSVRIRIAGTELQSQILDAIRHARVDQPTAAPALTIDLWDVRATGVVPPPTAHWPVGTAWVLGKGTLASSTDGRFISHALRSAVVCLDRETRHIVGWYRDGTDVSLHQRGKPLQMLIALWASDRGVVAIHSACVARNGDAVLVPGRSGSGKSTTALACVQAGFDFLGDDWIGLGETRATTVHGYGLYTSTYLDAQHAERFAALAAHVIQARTSDEEKSLLFLSDLFLEQLRTQTTICAIALPRIVDERATRVRRAAKRDALLVLAPTSVFEMHPRPGREAIERIAELVQSVPTYWLEIGSDLHDIPRAVGEILDAVRR